MTRPMLRPGVRLCLSVLGVGLALLQSPAGAQADPGADPGGSAGSASTSQGAGGVSAVVQPTGARAGEPVTVNLEGWPAGTEIQAVLCGQLGIGGSNACQLPGAAIGRVDPAGKAMLQLTVHAPPRPCPCVIRVRAFSGAELALDLPFEVVGHRRGPLPVTRTPTAELSVSAVRVEGGADLRSLFALGGRATVVATVTNRGDAAGPAPVIWYGVGEEGRELSGSFASDLVVPARQSRAVEFEVSLPAGAVGAQRARVRLADARGPGVVASWSTHPWGWLLVVPGLLVLVLLRRLPRGTAAQSSPVLPAATTGTGSYPLPDVVWVEGLGALLVNPDAVRRSRLLGRVGGRIRLEDLPRVSRASIPAPRAYPAELIDDISHSRSTNGRPA